MGFLKLWATFLDFLFPKSKRVLNLEKIRTTELLSILPPADRIKDENVIALFDYKNTLTRELVWQLKYEGNRNVAEKFGEILYDIMVSELEERNWFEKFPKPLLMPMPISDKRRFERGWNQAEILCEEVMRRDSSKMFRYKPRQLVKHFHTERQTTTTSKVERLSNIKNTMKLLAPKVVEGEYVILVDDVFTTGATYTEARRALRDAGAKKILFFSVAH
jgi:competence protein ComFC